MTVDDATGLPVSLGVDETYLLTLSDGPVETLWEILLVEVNRAGNVITIVRQQEGSSMPASWPIGTFVSARVTAATMDGAIGGGGGGGGAGDEFLRARNLFWYTTPGDGGSLGEWYMSFDGGGSWDGQRWDNGHGLSGGDIEDPKLALGSGIRSKGLTAYGTAFV